MKAIRIILLLTCCVAALSCTPNPPPPPAAPPAALPTTSPAVSEGTPIPEVGDTSAPTFEGTVGVTSTAQRAQPPAILKAVRSGRHDNFDRIVFEFTENGVPAYRVEYKNQPVRSCGSGDVVSLAGTGRMVIQLLPAQAHDGGDSTISAREKVLNFPMIKEWKTICDFEADLQFALGVTSVSPYRVLELQNPGRLVVDIRH